MEEQINEESRKIRIRWVDTLWNLDKNRFPLLFYRLRHGCDPSKDSRKWELIKAANILNKHTRDSIRAAYKPESTVIRKSLEHSTPPALDNIDKLETDPDMFTCNVKMT